MSNMRLGQWQVEHPFREQESESFEAYSEKLKEINTYKFDPNANPVAVASAGFHNGVLWVYNTLKEAGCVNETVEEIFRKMGILGMENFE